jgi:hypothetical protein
MSTTSPATPAPRLTPEEIGTRFAALQGKLAPQWRLIRALNHEPHTVVVVPSMSLDVEIPAAVLQAYEERMLFLLLLLRQARTRLIYVTSQPILPEIIDYYLALLPGIIPSQARRRLFTMPVLDGSSRPLSEKILERPRMLARLRELIPDPDTTHLVPFATSELEQELAVRLGIPMYAADPRFFVLGTKSGGRRLFAEEGVPHPAGREELASLDELVAAIRAIRAERAGVAAVIVKLNDAVSGMGNALVELDDVPPPGAPAEEEAVRRQVRAMRLESDLFDADSYLGKLAAKGGVVEERIAGDEVASPSVQLRVTPDGEVQLLSTHDQLLGGPSGQSYLGCVFPADPGYAVAITREAEKIGKRLAREGVIGRFALDFMAVRSQGGPWRVYAIEINLRKGGTTHPYLTLEFLSDGHYDPARAVFTAPGGREKCYVASDHVESPLYRSLTPEDLFDLAIRQGLHFNQATQTGIVFHMISCVTGQGRFGITAVGNSTAEAKAIYERALASFEQEARAALHDPGPSS